MKTFLLLLIASSLVLAAPLTPNTHLPGFARDSLENTLQRAYPILGSPNRNVAHAVSSFFAASSLKVAADFLAAELPWLSVAAKKLIVLDAKNSEEQSLNSHFVSQGHDGGRYEALVFVVKDEGALRIFVSKEALKTASRAGIPDFHEKRHSIIGFPLSQPEYFTPVKASSNQIRYFENSRLRLLNELYERIGTKKANRMLGADVLGMITQVANAWKAIADNFKTTKSETLQGITNGKGFSQYKSDAVVFKHEGIRLSLWHIYKRNFGISIGYGDYPELISKSNDWLDLATMIDDFAVGVNDMIFDIRKDGDCASNVFMSQKDDMAQKMHILAMVTKGAFKLSPDVWIYECNLSVAGGIYKESHEKREYKARNLTEDDIKALTALASLNAINKFTDFFKIDFKLPTDKPTDFCQK